MEIRASAIEVVQSPHEIRNSACTVRRTITSFRIVGSCEKRIKGTVRHLFHLAAILMVTA
jgi:hypothetical protein